MIVYRRDAGNSLHIGKFRLCKSAEKNCSETDPHHSRRANKNDSPRGAVRTLLSVQSTVPTTKQMMEHTRMKANSAKVTFLRMLSLPFSLFLP